MAEAGKSIVDSLKLRVMSANRCGQSLVPIAVPVSRPTLPFFVSAEYEGLTDIFRASVHSAVLEAPRSQWVNSGLGSADSKGLKSLVWNRSQVRILEEIVEGRARLSRRGRERKLTNNGTTIR
jgi:hypothetical protein